jgi:hypothetical protein
MQVTYLPQGPERSELHFDRSQFIKLQQPVEAYYVGNNNGENGWQSTNLGYEDIRRMSTEKRKTVGRVRRLNTPDYMLDEKRFRAAVIRYLELRVQFRCELGTETERLQRLMLLLKRKADWASAQLDNWCAMFVAATDDTERRRCQRFIGEYDTTVRICREPWVIPQMCRAYYYEGLDSVGVGMRVGFRSDHVRQILYRIGRLDSEIQAGCRLLNGRRTTAETCA